MTKKIYTARQLLTQFAKNCATSVRLQKALEKVTQLVDKEEEKNQKQEIKMI